MYVLNHQKEKLFEKIIESNSQSLKLIYDFIDIDFKLIQIDLPNPFPKKCFLSL